MRPITTNRLLQSLALESLVVIGAMTTAFALRFDFQVPPLYLRVLLIGLAIAVPAKLLTFWLCHLERIEWRFITARDLLAILKANLWASIALTPLLYVLTNSAFPRSLYLLDFLMCTGILAGAKCFIRALLESPLKLDNAASRAVLIYGAGISGVALAKAIAASERTGYHVVGFLDDDDSKQGSQILGIPVLGSSERLTSVLASLRQRGEIVHQLIVGIPSARSPILQAIHERCHDAGILCKVSPGVNDVLEDRVRLRRLRPLSLVDLLEREQAPSSLDSNEHLEGRAILVTGGAGSIGSELCRQIAACGPAVLVVFDQSENDVFKLDLELRSAFPGLDLVSEIGDIRDANHVADVMAHHRIERIFHAAAYKHVPLLESNVLEAVWNNVVGTWNVVDTARRLRIPSLLAVSSDKAVNPSSIMGLTKRISELIVSGAAASSQDLPLRYVSVRFGNVLGTNGSVVPIFQQQIEQGGPVTVTHPDMKRYFMTVTESVRLLLAASSIGAGGEVFALDMGEPIGILALAQKMIRLAGLDPERDIQIRFTGVRPGEKLQEVLSFDGERFLPTEHPRIRICRVGDAGAADLSLWISTLQELLRSRQTEAVVMHLRGLEHSFVPALGLAIPAVRKAAAPHRG